ncbi:MAG: OmpH family outer membrane protein [Acidobacteria bacterium]|nr:OmpH family outer membrane protein [Acidobacteriota bacterium]
MSHKRVLFMVCLGAALTLGVVAQQGKIGFVDSTKAILTCDEGKAEYEKINLWLKKQDEQIQDLQKRLGEKQNQFQTQQSMLSDEKKEELLKDMDRLDTEIKRRTEDVKKEYARKLDEFGAAITKKMTPLFSEFAKTNNYSLILYLNPQVIAYYNLEADITDELIKRFNQSYPYTAKPSEDSK